MYYILSCMVFYVAPYEHYAALRCVVFQGQFRDSAAPGDKPGVISAHTENNAVHSVQKAVTVVGTPNGVVPAHNHLSVTSQQDGEDTGIKTPRATLLSFDDGVDEVDEDEVADKVCSAAVGAAVEAGPLAVMRLMVDHAKDPRWSWWCAEGVSSLAAGNGLWSMPCACYRFMRRTSLGPSQLKLRQN